jgi:hypothetical protein
MFSERIPDALQGQHKFAKKPAVLQVYQLFCKGAFYSARMQAVLSRCQLLLVCQLFCKDESCSARVPAEQQGAVNCSARMSAVLFCALAVWSKRMSNALQERQLICSDTATPARCQLFIEVTGPERMFAVLEVCHALC